MTLTEANIRTYMKDTPSLNILLEGEYQSSTELIALAMSLALSDYNTMPPQSSYSLSDFPGDSVLLHGTLYHLCNSEAERQLRNQVSYNAQGLNAGLDDKMPQYNQLALHYYNMFMSSANKLKQHLNTEDAWGGVDSPYSVINVYEYRR